ncbi:hydroxyethylthiazole kinase [Halobacillus dabanensis]|uniref:Hydroxyethylthiazole kinase n=1 Tax=Halobacillus dabanensis TaxID=240302 RepID=A0A1I4AQT1_HALDA|nr:hydroxyethylthiazole kinase [Halobacillus dabanensis]SFK58888.1 hydroxyethylthiazole kinase [Halobacillus dabanensis]
MNTTVIERIRTRRPLIHHITNAVVMNFTANGLLAFGGSPIMANASEEVGEVTRVSNGLLLNIGTLTETQVKAMILAGRAANETGIPVVLDPVGVAATSYRSEVCERILGEVQPTLIKGNAGELAHLVGIEMETKGVDSTGSGNLEDIVRRVAEKYQTGAVCTGEKDVVWMDGEIKVNRSGHPLLSQITGSGCLLGSLVAAALAVDGKPLENVTAVLRLYGEAAEKAAAHKDVEGPGTFLPRFIDALAKESWGDDS